MNELLDVLKTGGTVMVVTKLVILLGSIAAVIIGIERALFLRGFTAKARELHEQIVRARGTHARFHYNGIKWWRLQKTGELTYA